MQAAGKLPDGHPRKYPSAFAAYGTIVRTEGVAALWTGLGPNVARNAIINAAELASYDQIKESLLRCVRALRCKQRLARGISNLVSPPPARSSGLFHDNVYCHITSGMGAGLFAVICGSPVDVVKSRMMGERMGWCEPPAALPLPTLPLTQAPRPAPMPASSTAL